MTGKIRQTPMSIILARESGTKPAPRQLATLDFMPIDLVTASRREAPQKSTAGSARLSQNPCLPPCGVVKGQIKHRQKVYRLLLLADKKAPEAIDPRGEPLDYLAAGTATAFSFFGLFFAARLDVRCIAASLNISPDGLCSEPLFATERLSLAAIAGRW